MPFFSVTASSPEQTQIARDFCTQQGYGYLENCDQDNGEKSQYCLEFTSSLPRLHDNNNKTVLEISFTAGGLAHRIQYGGGQGQTIARAIGIKKGNKPHVLDATAGLGRDAWVIANLGCPLTLCEQSPVLHVMLESAIREAALSPGYAQVFENGFELVRQNSIDYMTSQPAHSVDVVYLDPMYPHRKKSALVKKEMQVLQGLIGSSSEEENGRLLAAALGVARQRVVVKRPKGAETLDGPAPTLSYDSKKTRYDVYVIRALGT